MNILVTGATSGFGAAIARRFVHEGHRVVATGRRAERLDALATECGERLHPLVLDVRDRAAVEAAVAALPAEFAQVDVLVNNAGLALGLKPAHETDMADWEQMVDTNIKGLLYITRALTPGMVDRGRGHVINLGSVAGEWPYPGGNVYGGTKAFVRQFSLNLRADLVGLGVRVSNIEPGMAETEFSLVRFQGDAERAKSVYAGVQPLTADDIADTVYWIATRPAHVNVNTISLMPECQAFSPFNVKR
ncbi:SDR family oxidoreductase [Solimonas marina]|uniref:SDR family oxidoreductase n=1 Tax=Solimonas marina TaxID=2714601 RepID=A0A970B704_9GAMM|nr:SDR family oxidoreductase [Solimonas marina]NKF23150.1 SDR family oxidoreductase [Solimonas marina]